MTRVMLSCGEASGDLYAGALAKELRALDPAVSISGFGGPRLAAAGGRLIGDYRGISVTGLVEVLRLLPRTWRMYRRLLSAALRDRPDVFVAIDFPDFNFRLGRALHARGIPVVYYVSPQLWAWRPGRLDTMRRFVDRVLVIFPFERELYDSGGVPVEFVGHPLVDLLGPSAARPAFLSGLGLDPNAPTIALLPGSRPNEVRLILPVLLEAANLLTRDMPSVQFVIARAPGLPDHLFAANFAVSSSPDQIRFNPGVTTDVEARRPASLQARHASPSGASMVVVEGRADDVLTASDVVVTASGTATVQTALHGRPMVIVYRLSPLTYRLGIRFVRVSTYGMVNLVAGRRIVPELIQDGCTPDAIARETLRYFRDPEYAAATRAALAEVRASLQGTNASRRAAEAILSVARSR